MSNPVALAPVSWQRMADGMHLRDLASVALVDEWVARFPEVLAGRLQMILDDPEG